MLQSGKALDRFRECIRLQGGDARVIDDYSVMPAAKFETDITSSKSGYLVATHCRDFGLALAVLEGGRNRKEDVIDPAVGLEFHKRIGDYVKTGEKLVTIQYNSEAKFGEVKKLIEESFILGEGEPLLLPLIRQVIGG